MSDSKNKRTILTKEYLAKPYQDKAKTLQILCMVELSLVMMLLLSNYLYVRFCCITRMTPTSLLTYIVVVVCLVATYCGTQWAHAAQKRADEIIEGRFSIRDDKICRMWYEMDGEIFRKPRQFVEAEIMGQLEMTNHDEWNACEKGDELYLVCDKNRKVIGIYPNTLYAKEIPVRSVED